VNAKRRAPAVVTGKFDPSGLMCSRLTVSIELGDEVSGNTAKESFECLAVGALRSQHPLPFMYRVDPAACP
jgi:hypothetical protein